MTNEDFIRLISSQYYKPLYQYIKQVCPDKNLAYDIVQDTFLIAYEKAANLKKHQNIRAWLYQTARYRMLHHLESILSYQELGELADTLDDGKNYEDAIIAKSGFYSEISRYLNPHELRLILCHYEYGYSCTELAEESHASTDSIRMRLQRIRRKLQKDFRQEYI